MSQEDLLKEVNVFLRDEGLDVAESLDEAMGSLSEIDMEAWTDRARSMAATIRARLEAKAEGLGGVS
ncbi:hypothetical protein D3C87_347900 [compost metagenome]